MLWYRKIVEYREAPYAQQEIVTTIAEEGSGVIESTVEYSYDGNGNVRTIKDSSEGLPTLEAEIKYLQNSPQFRAHPVSIVVKSGDKVIRERTGKYNGKGALIEQTQKDGRGNDVTAKIEWDAYGNLQGIRNGASWVRYAWDEEHNQFPETITRGAEGADSYVSRIKWDPRLGVKEKETDENGNVITYEYNDYGYLEEVYSPYDTEMPAVRYEYCKPTETQLYYYTVTHNKISTDPDDEGVIRTVIAADGLGRAFITAKDGAKREGNEDIPGWNIAGPVSLDEKGRTAAQGQSLFLAGESIDILLQYRFPAPYSSAYNPYGLLNPTLIEYDSQDRQIKVELPDGAVETTEYDIRDRKSVVTVTDPLQNISIRETDARGNIVSVKRLDDSGILTSATYEYNAIGEMLKALDHNGNVLTVEYDLMGRRTAMQSPDMGRKEYHYDRFGNLERESDSVLRGRGAEIIYRYDSMHRLVKIDYPDSVDTE